MAELDLIAALSARQGALGRAATVYGVTSSAGWTLGLDLGSTQVHAHARGLNGQRIFESTVTLARQDVDDKVAAIRTLMSRVRRAVGDTNGPLYTVGIALPRIVSDYLETGVSDSHGTPDIGSLIHSVGADPGIPILIENNVNCAALAEMDGGIAQRTDDFGYLQIGVGIGAGIVAGGRVLRGAHGGAGELSAIPNGWPARHGQDPFELERYLGSDGLLRRCSSAWTDESVPAPRTVPELFSLAGQGHATAMQVIDQHAADIGQLALTLVAVTDPDLIVLGGGVGRNPALTEGVREVVRRVQPRIRVEASELGDTATVAGAAALALDHALSGLLGRHHERRLDIRVSHVVNTD